MKKRKRKKGCEDRGRKGETERVKRRRDRESDARGSLRSACFPSPSPRQIHLDTSLTRSSSSLPLSPFPSFPFPLFPSSPFRGSGDRLLPLRPLARPAFERSSGERNSSRGEIRSVLNRLSDPGTFRGLLLSQWNF